VEVITPPFIVALAPVVTKIPVSLELILPALNTTSEFAPVALIATSFVDVIVAPSISRTPPFVTMTGLAAEVTVPFLIVKVPPSATMLLVPEVVIVLPSRLRITVFPLGIVIGSDKAISLTNLTIPP
jgi:hypothetical protein